MLRAGACTGFILHVGKGKHWVNVRQLEQGRAQVLYGMWGWVNISQLLGS